MLRRPSPRSRPPPWRTSTSGRSPRASSRPRSTAAPSESHRPTWPPGRPTTRQAPHQLHGLGWGAAYAPPGDPPDGPEIDLCPTHGTHHHPIDPDHPVEWCAYLPGDPDHGACDTIGEALDLAVASIAGRLASLNVAAA